jgi:hypothetical protein
MQFAYGPDTYGLPTDLIDYKTTTGAKIQKAATEKLEVSHDMDAEHLYLVLEALWTWAIANGWIETLFTIMRGQLAINIPDNYGILTVAEVLAKVQTYMFQDIQASQDSHNSF